MTIHAAGVALWRRTPAGELEVAVVHRPRYDDWSLPKGKSDNGETVPETAYRETVEETGYRPVLGRRLPSAHYSVEGRAKVVDYFSARVAGGSFLANEEVDRLRWLSPAKAAKTVTHRHDRAVLAELTAVPVDLTTVLLVRHAKAGKRDEWPGEDDLRPLSPAGLRQAAGLRRLLPLFGADRVHSAPLVRCADTVRGVAEDLDTQPIAEPLLSERHYWDSPSAGVARLLEIAAAGGTPVVSSQGGVIPDLVTRLADLGGVELPAVQAKKGSLWVLSLTPADNGRSGAAPRLVAADYYPSPLPAPRPSGKY
ncbi:NUDIX hydrolase [Kutzneria viridogrisea]|uniref:8-oxo-dGTP diphosphatase n=1 Tax=Kutzneria viridogrisea TaxID=47990 RepID=A0ABR6BGL2_9PSEU|nr:8-oxo-dGTP diphosphatase [Kutzneria viridogrisea]